MRTDPTPPIFLGGAYRSGLTLLRAILDSHSRIACPPDLAIVPTVVMQCEQVEQAIGDNLARNYATDRTALRAAFVQPILDIFASARRKAGKKFIVDKTPVNVLAFPHLRQMCPDSPLVHVLRDGRDVAASLLAQGWRDPHTDQLLPMCASVSGAGRHWRASVMQALAAGQQAGGVLVIRYEQLVTDPRSALAPLLEALELQFEENMLRFHEYPRDYIELETGSVQMLRKPLDVSRVGRWRRDLGADQQRRWGQEFGSLQSSLGYE